MANGLLNYRASASGCYTASRAAALAGVPKSTVYSWAKAEVVVPSVSPVREKLWSFQDLLTLRAVHWLRQRKGEIPASPMHEVRVTLEQTVAKGLDPWSDRSIQLCVDLSGRIFIQRAGHVRSTVHGQGAWEYGETVDLFDAIGGSPGLVQPTKHVRIAPARLAGEPFLLDTRVGTQSLAALADDGYPAVEIANLYQLPVLQVREALDYEERLAA